MLCELRALFCTKKFPGHNSCMNLHVSKHQIRKVSDTCVYELISFYNIEIKNGDDFCVDIKL